ncbi:MAG: DUF2971 domain-containing protein, partial [Candidatus Delongbacteria bacterium]|nr:DUF2971 domain-containing protein [Candidatus Delongbacteria bacterium]
MIRNNYLWFSDPSTFNDPYDFNISFDYSCNENILREYYKKVREKYKLMGDNSFESYDVEQLISEYLQDPEKFINDHKQCMQEKKQNDYGVCCFSEKCNNLLMWSHYGDKHKGICLGFNTKMDKDFFLYPFKVDYPSKFPTYNYFENKFDKKILYTQFHFATKSKDWKYEKELRIVKYNKIRGKIQFKKEIICEVIFGYKTDKEIIKKVLKLFERYNYNVRFYQMVLK